VEVADLPSSWWYTEKECLTRTEFSILSDIKAQLHTTGIQLKSHGSIEETLSSLCSRTTVVFAFFPTPQLMRGSNDKWLRSLISKAQQMSQSLILVVTHSKQFLQRLQLDPCLDMQKGAISDPPFPVAAAHRLEQELEKGRKARLYRKTHGSCASDAFHVKTTMFWSKYAAEVSNEELKRLVCGKSSDVVFFGEGAGLGLLSASAITSMTKDHVEKVASLLESHCEKLQAERVNSYTTKLPWSQVLPVLNQ
jgi:hypothetical protein